MALAERAIVSIVDGGRRGLDLEGLVAWIAAGNEPAVARFYEATSGLIFGLLLLILGDTTKAEAVLSEVYAEVRQHAGRFDKNHDSISTWLITIAHRRALEHHCSAAQGSGRTHRFGLSKSAHRKMVGATLDALSPAERRMIELAYFSRLTPRAIALRLQQSPETVQTGLQHGISQLYNLFKNQGFLSELMTSQTLAGTH